jgi:hypothetical protein
VRREPGLETLTPPFCHKRNNLKDFERDLRRTGRGSGQAPAARGGEHRRGGQHEDGLQTFENSDPGLDDLLSEWVKVLFLLSPRATYSFNRVACSGDDGQVTPALAIRTWNPSLTARSAALSLNPKLARAYVLLLQRNGPRRNGKCMKVGSVLNLLPASHCQAEMMSAQPRWEFSQPGSVLRVAKFVAENASRGARDFRLR